MLKLHFMRNFSLVREKNQHNSTAAHELSIIALPSSDLASTHAIIDGLSKYYCYLSLDYDTSSLSSKSSHLKKSDRVSFVCALYKAIEKYFEYYN